MLAPMADVTDAAFRRIIASYGKPDVMWTEFISADGLYHTREIQKMSDEENPLMKDLLFSDSERPIVAQLFTAKPEMMEYAARLVEELGFDGIDINMGCPDRSIEKQGAGAALIKNPKLAAAIIAAARKGASSLPVSVKTRVGYSAREEIETWVPSLLNANPDALIIHARTRKEMSDVPARWAHIARAVEMRNAISPRTLIFGNGDIIDIKDARQKISQSGADGAMLGRAIFGNPWLFNTTIAKSDIDIVRRLNVMVEHTKLFVELLPHKNFSIMKKHYKAYVSGFDGAKDLRMELMEANSAENVEKIATHWLASQKS